MRHSFQLLTTMLCASLMPFAAQGAATDPTIEGAKQCTKNIARYERYYGIPSHLLSAIAATESGRYHQGLKISLPWPWTINAEGKGQYFSSKTEAVAAVKRLQMQGVRSIDIGCMQVNLVHHPEAFASIEEAFDPERNVAYGASFLRNLYEENQSWKQAAASYHSKTPTRGTEYAGRVYDRWYNIVDRLRAVKADIPEATMAALNNQELPAKPVELKMASVAQPQVINVKPVVTSALPEQVGRNVPNYQSPRMNSISVNGGDRERQNGVLVIRPKIIVVDDSNSPETLTVAESRQVNAISSAQVINVAQPSDKIVAKSGPRFIFEN